MLNYPFINYQTNLAVYSAFHIYFRICEGRKHPVNSKHNALIFTDIFNPFHKVIAFGLKTSYEFP